MKYWMVAFMMSLVVGTSASYAEDTFSFLPLKKWFMREQITQDQKVFDALQERLSLLKQSGVPEESYLFAKAHKWLDFALDEYTQTYELGIVEQQALQQTSYLIGLMENKALVYTNDTPSISGSKRVRPDLWDIVATLKQRNGFVCGGNKVAELEVVLVWAGYKEKTVGFPQSMSYIQEAERLASEASVAVSSCRLPTPAPLVQVAEGLSHSSMVTLKEINRLDILADRVHFALNKSYISHKTAAVLNEIALVLRNFPSIQVRLNGHTDVVGSHQYNMVLSKRRAEAVGAYLAVAGIPQDRMTYHAYGKTRLADIRKDKKGNAINRRVEFIVKSNERIQTVRQFDDLQMEKEKIKSRSEKSIE